MVDAPDGWNDEIGYGAHNVSRPPLFVVTHRPTPAGRLGLDFTFVTDGSTSAVDAALAACPAGKDVVIMGGGKVIAQVVDWT